MAASSSWEFDRSNSQEASQGTVAASSGNALLLKPLPLTDNKSKSLQLREKLQKTFDRADYTQEAELKMPSYQQVQPALEGMAKV